MARTLRDKIAELPKGRRVRVKRRTEELIAEEVSLQALRKAFHKTQVQVARELKVGQDTVSRIEGRADLLLSTLSNYVRALGGDLVLLAEFPDRAPVRLHRIGDLRNSHASEG